MNDALQLANSPIMWFFALLSIIVVQAAAVAFIFGYGYVDGVNGLNIEQLTATPIG